MKKKTAFPKTRLRRAHIPCEYPHIPFGPALIAHIKAFDLAHTFKSGNTYIFGDIEVII